MRTLITRAKDWMMFRNTGLGLLAGFGIAVVFGALLTSLTVPIGPSRQLTGTVLGFSFTETEFGSRIRARTQIPGREAMVRLPMPNGCRVGSLVALVERQFIWGKGVFVESGKAPCSNP